MTTKSRIFHSDPDILGGIPVFVGTRVPVKTLLDYLEAGDSLDEFLDHFPSVSREQAVAGLNQLTTAEAEQMARNNAQYREKFGFPFIVCASLNNAGTIRDAFAKRLENSRSQEIRVALEEISKIGRLRLAGAIS